MDGVALPRPHSRLQLLGAVLRPAQRALAASNGGCPWAISSSLWSWPLAQGWQRAVHPRCKGEQRAVSGNSDAKPGACLQTVQEARIRRRSRQHSRPGCLWLNGLNLRLAAGRQASVGGGGGSTGPGRAGQQSVVFSGLDVPCQYEAIYMCAEARWWPFAVILLLVRTRGVGPTPRERKLVN